MREVLYIGVITLVEEESEAFQRTNDGAYIGW